MKILFLDIDGVILSGDALRATGDNRYLPLDKIDLLKSVCDRTGAIICVSSTWRFTDDTRVRLTELGLPIHDDWRTPFEREMDRKWGQYELRGCQIQQWLDSHPEVTNFAILDDDNDMLPAQKDHFVQTKFEKGMDISHAKELCRILGEL